MCRLDFPRVWWTLFPGMVLQLFAGAAGNYRKRGMCRLDFPRVWWTLFLGMVQRPVQPLRGTWMWTRWHSQDQRRLDSKWVWWQLKATWREQHWSWAARVRTLYCQTVIVSTTTSTITTTNITLYSHICSVMLIWQCRNVLVLLNCLCWWFCLSDNQPDKILLRRFPDVYFWRQTHLTWSNFDWTRNVFSRETYQWRGTMNNFWFCILIHMQESWSWLPPKSNWLAFGRPVRSKKFHSHPFITCWDAAKCQFILYLLMVKNPAKWSRIHERLWIATKM